MKANRESYCSTGAPRARHLFLFAGLAICWIVFSVAGAEAATVRFHNRSGLQVRIESKFPNGANGPSVTISNGASKTLTFNARSLRVRAVATGGTRKPSGWHLVTGNRTLYVKKTQTHLIIQHHP
jgi:hypothetical protein